MENSVEPLEGYKFGLMWIFVEKVKIPDKAGFPSYFVIISILYFLDLKNYLISQQKYQK